MVRRTRAPGSTGPAAGAGPSPRAGEAPGRAPAGSAPISSAPTSSANATATAHRVRIERLLRRPHGPPGLPSAGQAIIIGGALRAHLLSRPRADTSDGVRT